MHCYFAYGSNMLRARLEERVGPVVVVGAAVLEGYAHSFTTLGRDGTGKGNITVASGSAVYGVAYRLQPAQLERLTEFERAYRMVSLSVRIHALPNTDRGTETSTDLHGAHLETISFQARRPVPPLQPKVEYLTYYERGMREHGLPEHYLRMVLAQARG